MKIVIEDAYELFGLFCDVAERAWQRIPQDEVLPYGMTSREARQAANRVMDELSKYAVVEYDCPCPLCAGTCGCKDCSREKF